MSMKVQKPITQKKERKELIVVYGMKTDTDANKKLSPIVTELFKRGRKLNSLFVFYKMSHIIRRIPNESKIQ